MPHITYVWKSAYTFCISKEFIKVLIFSQGGTYNLEAHEYGTAVFLLSHQVQYRINVNCSILGHEGSQHNVIDDLMATHTVLEAVVLWLRDIYINKTNEGRNLLKVITCNCWNLVTSL